MKAARLAWNPIDPEDFLTAPAGCGSVVKEQQICRQGPAVIQFRRHISKK
jgi:hypothetical protein